MELIMVDDGALPIAVYVKLPSKYNTSSYYYKTIDPIVDLLSYTYVPVGSYPMSLLTKDITARYGTRLTLEKDAPLRPKNNIFISEYLGSFGRFKFLFDVLNRTLKVRSPNHEHSVLHTSSSGIFMPLTSDDYVEMSTVNYSTVLFPVFSYPQFLPSYYGPALSIKKEITTSRYYPVYPVGQVVKPVSVEVYLNDIGNKVSSGGYGGTVLYSGWYSYTHVSNFVWAGNPLDGYDITYDFRWNFSNLLSNVISNPRYGWTFSNKISLLRLDNQNGSLSAMAQNTIRTIFTPVKLLCRLVTTTTSRYQNAAPYPNYSPVVGQVDTSSITSEEGLSIGFPSYTSASASVDVLKRQLSYSGYDGFKDLCINYKNDFRGAAFFSASSAIDNLLGSVGTNFLQSLPKLAGFMNVLPDISGALNALANLKNDPVQSVDELLKVISGGYLQTIFGTRSNYELLVKYVPSFLEVLNDLSTTDRASALITHGSYTFTLPEPFLPSTVLRVFSKLVVSDIPSEPIRSILGLNSLGILPTPQRLWDLVPLSFVVNWLTNLGPLMSALQNVVIGQVMTIEYGVHSYTVSSPVPDSLIAAMGLKSTELVAPTYKWYQREVSPILPSPSLSRLEFYKAPGLPNWMTPAALLVQRL